MPPYDREYYEGKSSNYSSYGGYGSRLFSISRFLVTRKAFSIIMKHKPVGSLADLGCAYGFLVEAARKRGFSPVGVDVSDYAVAEARRRFPCADIRNLDLENGLDLQSGAYDVVTAMDVLEHCKNLDGTLRDVMRIMKDDGILLASVPDSELFPEHIDKDMTHHWRMTMQEWQDRFSRAGFDVLDSWVFPSFLRRVAPRWCVSLVLLRKSGRTGRSS